MPLSDMRTGNLATLEIAARNVDHHTEHDHSTDSGRLIADMLDVVASVQANRDGTVKITRDQGNRLIRATYFLVLGLVDLTETDDTLRDGQNTMALARQIETVGGKKVAAFIEQGYIHRELASIIAELSDGANYGFTRTYAEDTVQRALGDPGAPATATHEARLNGAYFNELAEKVIPITTKVWPASRVDVSEDDLGQTAWALQNLQLDLSGMADSAILDANRWYELEQGTKQVCLAAADLIVAKGIVDDIEDPSHRLGTAMQAITLARKIFGETDSTECNFRGVLIAAIRCLLDGNASEKARDLAAEIAKVKVHG